MLVSEGSLFLYDQSLENPGSFHVVALPTPDLVKLNPPPRLDFRQQAEGSQEERAYPWT